MNKSRSFEYEKKTVKSAVRFPNEILNREIYLWTPPVSRAKGLSLLWGAENRARQSIHRARGARRDNAEGLADPDAHPCAPRVGEGFHG